MNRKDISEYKSRNESRVHFSRNEKDIHDTQVKTTTSLLHVTHDHHTIKDEILRLVKRGNGFYHSGKYEDSLACFECAFKLQKQEGQSQIVIESATVTGVYLANEADTFNSNIDIELFDISSTLNNLALVHRKLGNYSTAESYYRKSYQIKFRHHNNNPLHPDLTICLHNLARLYSEVNNVEKAINYYLQALKIIRYNFGNRHIGAFHIYSHLGQLCYSSNDYVGCIEFCGLALEIYDEITRDGKEKCRLYELNVEILNDARNKI